LAASLAEARIVRVLVLDHAVVALLGLDHAVLAADAATLLTAANAADPAAATVSANGPKPLKPPSLLAPSRLFVLARHQDLGLARKASALQPQRSVPEASMGWCLAETPMKSRSVIWQKQSLVVWVSTVSPMALAPRSVAVATVAVSLPTAVLAPAAAA